jgi:hypothetical protein
MRMQGAATRAHSRDEVVKEQTQDAGGRRDDTLAGACPSGHAFSPIADCSTLGSDIPNRMRGGAADLCESGFVAESLDALSGGDGQIAAVNQRSARFALLVLAEPVVFSALGAHEHRGRSLIDLARSSKGAVLPASELRGVARQRATAMGAAGDRHLAGIIAKIAAKPLSMDGLPWALKLRAGLAAAEAVRRVSAPASFRSGLRGWRPAKRVRARCSTAMRTLAEAAAAGAGRSRVDALALKRRIGAGSGVAMITDATRRAGSVTVIVSLASCASK